MTVQRDPDARSQAQLDHDPGAAPHDVGGHQQWITTSTDPHTINPVALGVLLSTIPTDDPRYVAARLAVELREERHDLIESSNAMSRHLADTRRSGHQHITHAELERRRSTYDGAVDEHHLALRADPDRGRARRRRAA